MISFHYRSAITENIFEYYGVSQIDGKMIPSELKREVDYEDELVAQMIKNHFFEISSFPIIMILFLIMNKIFRFEDIMTI